MVVGYLALIEVGKRCSTAPRPPRPVIRHRNPAYRLLRRAARFTTADSLPDREEPRHSPEPAHGNPRAT